MPGGTDEDRSGDPECDDDPESNGDLADYPDRGDGRVGDLERGEGPGAASVADHYDRPGLTDRVLAGLEQAGADLNDLSRADLGGLAEFHLEGRAATRDLASMADAGPDELVLDVGAGLGGPARTLAAERGCRVLALELTASYCRAGTELTRRVGLTDDVAHCRGDACRLPVTDGAVDVVWVQHLLANVSDPSAALSEFARVLPARGRLAVHEVFAGPTTPVRYPLPFASDRTVGAPVPPDRFLEATVAAGFRRTAWTETTDETVGWYEDVFEHLADRPADAPQPAGLGLVLGDRFEEMTRTMYRNLAEGRLRAFRGVFEPDPENGSGGRRTVSRTSRGSRGSDRRPASRPP